MRDIVVMVAFLGLLPLCFSRPFVGMLVWTWFTVMNPHREAFTFASDFQFNAIIALATIAGFIFSEEKFKPIWSWGIAFMMLFFFWTILTTQMALQPLYSWEFMMRIPIKVYVYIALLVIMLNREERIISLLWIFVFSLGYYGVNIGILGILQFGSNIERTGNFGPADTMIQDRNQMALALCTIIPLLQYLASYVHEKWIKLCLWAVLAFTVISIIVSYSRGGWICLMLVGFYYFWFVKNKLIYIAMGAVAGFIGLFIMADEWIERMSLSNLEEDGSFNGRIEAWKISLEVALNHPIFGSGFLGPQHVDTFAKYQYSTKLEDPLAAHSMYFQVLGDHGFVGIGLFMIMIAAGAWANYKVRKITQDNPEMHWCRDLSNSLQVSLGVFCFGAGALSLAYFDVLYILLILSFALLYLTQKKITTDHMPSARRSYLS